MNNSQNTEHKEDENQEKSFFGIIVHSFFIIPFLIAVFCVLLFASVSLLTREQKTAFDYLEDVKTGGATKRWQAAFELSKILSHKDLVPEDARFENELINAFEKSAHDDPRVRQYLALAMGSTGNSVYLESLMADLETENESNVHALLYALGMLKNKRALPALYKYVNHPNPRFRSLSVASIGHINDASSAPLLVGALSDQEPNVRWSSAIALAKMGNKEGKGIIYKMLNREYLNDFENVDEQEQTQLLLVAIDASENILDEELKVRLNELASNDKNMNIRSRAMYVLNK